jgi:hypothetical protein
MSEVNYQDNVTPLQGGLGQKRGPIMPPTGEPPDDTMSVRVAKLEVAIKGLRDSVNVVLAVAGLLVLILLYGISRIDTLNDRVNALPNQISGDLRDIAKTLAESITAAKQQPPQVILMQPPPVQEAPAVSAPSQRK